MANFVIPDCCNVTDDSRAGGLGEEKAVEEAKIKQGKLSGKFPRSVFPPSFGAAGCNIFTSHPTHPGAAPLPLRIQVTDLRNNQTCPFPEQKTSPKQISSLTPGKQELEGK